MSELNKISNDTKTLTSDVVRVESWLKQHERLIIIFMVLIFSFFVLDKGLSVVASWEQHKATQAEKVLDAQKAKNDADLATAKGMLSDYQTQLAADTKEIAALTTAQASRDKVVVVQQKADAAMPPSQLATRWQGLVGDSGVVPVATGYTVSDSAALTTVQNLEQVPVLKADLADEQSKTAALQKDVASANDLIGQGKLVVNGLQLQLTDKDKACTAELNAEKAKARKSKLKWFGIGYVTGFISGQVAHAFGF